MSGDFNIIGTIKLPKPPIKIGITIKKIIIIACIVRITLYNCPDSPQKTPGLPNSKRIKKDNPLPTKPDQTPTKKYITPISLCLVLSNQETNLKIRTNHIP